jgi:3-keto-disaccharide hydrolase
MHSGKVWFFKPLSVAVLAAWSAVSCQHTSPESSAQTMKPWRSLFDGSSKAGWEMTGPGELKLVNGELVTEGGMGLLWYTKEKLGHCQVRVVFKLTDAHDNSGVFIRIPDRPPDPWFGVNKGYEVQIDNNEDEWHRTGCLYSLTKALHSPDAKVGEWTTMLITLDGKRTLVEVNGQPVTDYTEGDPVPEKKIWYEPDRGTRPEFGYIGLQNHGGDAHVHFKEVSVRAL